VDGALAAGAPADQVAGEAARTRWGCHFPKAATLREGGAGGNPDVNNAAWA